MQYILNETEWEDISALKLRVFAYWNDYHPYHSAGGGGGVICYFSLSVSTCIWSVWNAAKSPPSYLSLTGVALSLGSLAGDFYHLQSREGREDAGRWRVDGGRQEEKQKAWYVL